ncbi:Origin recognition complex subunit 5 [Smittium mucronatum]|uniref:Origin recognition complex subunit 5 n=1 Tax=Smittium mucronatum TaxID=133383 RepID=A0A1R0GZ46_9FUNG|nr:Origin recognition complex subunit 5 [Smittium mucronatum]
MDSIKASLSLEFPGRDRQIDRLSTIISEPGVPSSPFVFVNGHTGTGKTSILSRFFQLYDSQFLKFSDQQQENPKPCSYSAFIDCIECFTPKVLFRRAFNSWFDQYSTRDAAAGVFKNCDNIEDFINLIKTLPNEKYTSRFLIDVTIILISTSPWENLRPSLGSYPEPILVQFCQYNKFQIIQILQSECPPTEPLDFFNSFVDLIYETFHRNCGDLVEIRQLVCLLYPKYVQPVFEGQATRNESARLFKLCQPYFLAAADKLYLREISSFDWKTKSMVASARNDYTTVEKSINHLASNIGLQELPFLTKYILISSFIASYNPPRLDLQYFAKQSEKKTRRKKNSAANDGKNDRVFSHST